MIEDFFWHLTTVRCLTVQAIHKIHAEVFIYSVFISCVPTRRLIKHNQSHTACTVNTWQVKLTKFYKIKLLTAAVIVTVICRTKCRCKRAGYSTWRLYKRSHWEEGVCKCVSVAMERWSAEGRRQVGVTMKLWNRLLRSMAASRRLACLHPTGSSVIMLIMSSHKLKKQLWHHRVWQQLVRSCLVRWAVAYINTPIAASPWSSAAGTTGWALSCGCQLLSRLLFFYVQSMFPQVDWLTHNTAYCQTVTRTANLSALFNFM